MNLAIFTLTVNIIIIILSIVLWKHKTHRGKCFLNFSIFAKQQRMFFIIIIAILNIRYYYYYYYYYKKICSVSKPHTNLCHNIFLYIHVYSDTCIHCHPSGGDTCRSYTDVYNIDQWPALRAEPGNILEWPCTASLHPWSRLDVHWCRSCVDNLILYTSVVIKPIISPCKLYSFVNIEVIEEYKKFKNKLRCCNQYGSLQIS